MMPEIRVDKLGVEVKVNDFVAYPYGNRTLLVGQVVKFTPKRIMVRELGYKCERLLPLDSVAKLDASDVLAYSLKSGKL